MNKEYTYGVVGLFFNGHDWQLSFASSTGYRYTSEANFPDDSGGYLGIIAHIKEQFAEHQFSATRVMLIYSPPGSTRLFPVLYKNFPPVIVVYSERLEFHEKRLGRSFSNKAELLAEASVSGLSTELLLLETTNVCTFKCLFCPQDKMSRKKERMPFEIAKKIVEEYAANGVGTMAFHLMGEPTTNPYLPQLIKLVDDYKIDHTLTTNASNLTKELSYDLLKSGLKRVQFSVQTFGEGQYYKFKRPSPRYGYEGVLQNIGDFFKLKWQYAPDVEVEIHVMDNSLYQPRGVSVIKNDTEAIAVVEFWTDFLKNAAVEAGQEDIAGLLSKKNEVRLARESWTHVNYFFEPSTTLKFKMAGHWTQEFLKEDEAVIVAAKGTCQQIAYGGTTQMAILANGDAVLCCFDYDGGTRIGNINENSLRELDKKANAFRESLAGSGRIPFKICRRCLGVRIKTFSVPPDKRINNSEIVLNGIAVYGGGKYSAEMLEKFQKIGIESLASIDEEGEDGPKGNLAGKVIFSIGDELPEEIEAVIFTPEWRYDVVLIEKLSSRYPDKIVGQIDLIGLNPFDRARIQSSVNNGHNLPGEGKSDISQKQSKLKSLSNKENHDGFMKKIFSFVSRKK